MQQSARASDEHLDQVVAFLKELPNDAGTEMANTIAYRTYFNRAAERETKHVVALLETAAAASGDETEDLVKLIADAKEKKRLGVLPQPAGAAQGGPGTPRHSPPPEEAPEEAPEAPEGPQQKKRRRDRTDGSEEADGVV
jgi:hypothetical protein